jgi:hypothetical protein
MRVNNPHAVAVLNILRRHIAQERGFTHAGLSNDVKMLTPVLGFDTEFLVLISKIGLREKIDVHFFYPTGKLIGGSPFLACTLGAVGALTAWPEK